MGNLKLKILSSREEVLDGESNYCYLCEGNLEDYVKSVPERYADYDVQRGIVNNVYLDRLTETIMKKKFIPPIVLIAEDFENESTEILINKYKILDGLQRTFRIKSIYNALNLFLKEHNNINNSDTKFKLSRKYKNELDSIDSDMDIFWTIVKIHFEDNISIPNLKNVFKESIQWFEVWSNLDKKEQINKMLILNAGHKPMDMKHQLELLFLNIISENQLPNFVRAKDVNSSFFYSKKKEGHIHLSHFISAILAFHNKTPITVDSKYLHNLQENLDSELEELKYYFQNANLEKLVEFIQDLDKLFNSEYKDTDPETGVEKNIGLEWLGRETILIGIFAAFGSFYETKKDRISFENILLEIKEEISKNIGVFNIKLFNECKTTSIDITKVNIGNIFKYTTYNAMSQFLVYGDKDIIDWDKYFKFGTKVYNESK